MRSKLKATEIKAKLTSNPCLWLAGQLWWCTATEKPVRTRQQDGYANVRVPYQVLGARLDGAHVGDLGLADDHLRDHTLDTEVHNLDRDKVVVGDVDEILGDGKKKFYWAEPTHSSMVTEAEGPLESRTVSCDSDTKHKVTQQTSGRCLTNRHEAAKLMFWSN